MALLTVALGTPADLGQVIVSVPVQSLTLSPYLPSPLPNRGANLLCPGWTWPSLTVLLWTHGSLWVELSPGQCSKDLTVLLPKLHLRGHFLLGPESGFQGSFQEPGSGLWASSKCSRMNQANSAPAVKPLNGGRHRHMLLNDRTHSEKGIDK